MLTMKRMAVLLFAVLVVAGAGPAYAQLSWDGNIYNKFLWGTDRLGTGLYNYTTIPGEGFGDSGQGTQLELYLRARFAKKVEFRATIQSRFNRNFWTNAGGFAGFAPASIDPTNPNFLASEFDPRSNQYIKLRGVQMVFTPGYKWFDSLVVGENDLGIYDPMVIGKIRYIDRFNIAAVQLSGNIDKRRFTWDVIRISSPFYLGPDNTLGQFQPQDATYGFQPKFKFSSVFDAAGIFEYANDIEVNQDDRDVDNGRSLVTRFENGVAGVRIGVHPNPMFDMQFSAYYAHSQSIDDPRYASQSYFGLSGFGPVLLGDNSGNAFKVDLAINDPLGKGLSFQVQYFNLGSGYSSLFSARREADVLLTEGFDAAFGNPGPDNTRFSVFTGDTHQPGFPVRTEIGYGGWTGKTVQVPGVGTQTDNEFTDFNEDMAETCIGWKGITINPVYGSGSLTIGGEYTYIGYNTDWQAFDDINRPVTQTNFPVTVSDAGIGHNYNNAYAPFRSDKQSQIVVIGANKSFTNGIEIFGKYKHISDKDNRLDSAQFLPYQPGDCPGGGVACANNRNFYSNGNSTADIYGNPPVIVGAGGAIGYQWKPFDSITDDDRDLSYNMFNIGIGKQLLQDIYGSILYEHYSADLQDGNTALQAYNLQSMASGKSTKNRLILIGRWVLPGLPEAGFEYNYNWGDFIPDFGGGFVPVEADAATAAAHNVGVGSLGFFGRFGGWNSIENRNFSQQRFKAYLKIIF